MNAPEAEIHTLDLPPGFNPADTTFENHDVNIIEARGFYYYILILTGEARQRLNQLLGTQAAWKRS
jgi:hypothetical protein